MSADPEPPTRLTEGSEHISPVPHRGGGPTGGRDGRDPRAASIRLLLLGLSVAGVLAALALWATGHGLAAWRLLAGDTLAILALLLLAR